jgi:hypothetical protein
MMDLIAGMKNTGVHVLFEKRKMRRCQRAKVLEEYHFNFLACPSS